MKTKPFVPKSKTEFCKFIRIASKKDLKAAGFGVMTNYEEEKGEEDNYLKPGEIHYLIPGRYFDLIPLEMPVISLFGKKKKFSKKEFPKDDLRFGMLSCGFIRKF